MYKKIVPHRVTRPNVEKILNTSNTSFLKFRPCPKDLLASENSINKSKNLSVSRKLYLQVLSSNIASIFTLIAHTSGTEPLLACLKNADRQH